MDLLCCQYELQFLHPFGVSSHIRTSTTSVFVSLESEGYTGYGEACLPAYLGETAEGTIRFLKKAQMMLRSYDATLPQHFLLNETDLLAKGNNAAKAAIDMALHDLYCKLSGKSYREMTGIPFSAPRETSFTIAIDHESKLEEKISAAADFKILKIKAGTRDDRALIKRVREFTDKPLYVDVNQGWHDKHFVLDTMHWMKTQNVVLVEQPMPADRIEDMRWVTARSPLPTFADESVKRMEDLQKAEGVFSGINIKLMKCTGLREALRMIAYCRKNGLQIMLGCMAESSCGTSAMAQLMHFADFVDLDAPLLYKNDPFRGVSYHEGRIHQNNLAGIGVLPSGKLNFRPPAAYP